ncbi:GspE/PulE family protein [Candidatus Sumerlaeota bacterium]
MRSDSLIKESNQLGKSLLEEGLITENQLRHALQLQQDSLNKKRLGEVFVEMGYVTKSQLREVSRKYDHRLQLGLVLTDQGIISEEDVSRALDLQRDSHGLLGEILLDSGVISEEQLAVALSKQLSYPYIVPNRRLVDKRLLKPFSEKFLVEYGVLPMFKNRETMTVLVQNPLDQTMIQVLNSVLNGKYELAVGPRTMIQVVLREVLGQRTLLAEEGGGPVEALESEGLLRRDLDAPQSAGRTPNQVIEIVDHLIVNAITDRASDIHIDSMHNRLRVRHRIDGKLIFETDLPQSLTNMIIRRIKVLARIDVIDSPEACDGHIYVKKDNVDIDLRVSMYPTVMGKAITIRTLSKGLGLKDLADLGMLPRALSSLKMILDAPSGLILFAGPTGAGKTTSLYACLNYLNTDDVKICTVESPVEYAIEGVAQCQIRRSDSDKMGEMVKAMLHQDPDAIVLGEINDEPSADAAVQAALSGHKVFSTIHTDDSFGAIHRLMGMGMRTYLLSGTGVATISQRLVRKICQNCRERFTPTRKLFRQFKIKGFDPDLWEFCHGRGCTRCNHTGFLDRTGVFEILTVDDEIRDAFLAGGNTSAIRKLAQASKQYVSLREAGFIKALLGETTLDEAFALLSYSEKQSFASMDLTESNIKYWMEIEEGQS